GLVADEITGCVYGRLCVGVVASCGVLPPPGRAVLRGGDPVRRRRRDPDARPVGRLPPVTRSRRVLAGWPGPLPRPGGVRPSGRRLDRPTPPPLTHAPGGARGDPPEDASKRGGGPR